MKLTIYTERGTFVGLPLDEAEVINSQNNVDAAVKGKADWLSMDTEAGRMIIGKEMLKTAVFVLGD